MRLFCKILCWTLILSGCTSYAQNNVVVITGTVTESENKKGIEQVAVKILSARFSGAHTSKNGEFILTVPRTEVFEISFIHPAYEHVAKRIKTQGKDSVKLHIQLTSKPNILDTVSIFAKHEPETLVGKPNYSIFDFDFYDDKLLLLTAENSLTQAKIMLADYNGNISSSFSLPKEAGEAKQFFHDYEGYTDIVCKDSVFRLDVWNNELFVRLLSKAAFHKYIEPVSDTLSGNYYINNKWDKYPSFNYYYLNKGDSAARVLATISNSDLLKLYNHEYYYLPSRMQLEARRIASYYKADVHIIAALMSGFTQSMFYEPLYAPLFVINDTICIFNHYNDHLYHYNKNNTLLDSVKISYHHPKNWREWKKQLFVDEIEGKVYASFSKDGHHFIKLIDHRSGKELMTYRLKHHSAEKMKLKGGYVYYVYRPFGSTQERFLYRERIE